MSPTRREVLAQLAAVAVLPLRGWVRIDQDPLDGTIADYQAGRRRGAWTALEVTTRALERCRTDGMRWHAIDALSPSALDEARAADARLRAGTMRGPLDGVPVFAKAIYDMSLLPTTGSNADWARLFPEPLRKDALEVSRLRVAGAIVLGKTAADDFAYHGNGTSSHTGQVLNPHDPTGTRTPGGSSAGTAVAVAAGMAFAATRHRRRWLQPHPGAVHRSGRDEADLRPRPAHRGDPDLALPRYPWAAGAHGRRCGTPPRRDRGAGPLGPAGAHRPSGTALRS